LSIPGTPEEEVDAMAEDGRRRDRRGRRQRRFLTPQHKYEVFLQLACRESTTMAEVARRWEVVPNTILRIRQVGKQAALEELPNSRPGRLRNGDPELAVAKAEIARLGEALKEMAVKVTLLEEKGGAGVVGGVHRRVDARRT
jgi:transposase-like protein